MADESNFGSYSWGGMKVNLLGSEDHKMRRNLLIVSSVSIYTAVEGVTVTGVSQGGISFQNLSTAGVVLVLLLSNVYILVHYFAVTWTAKAKWELQLNEWNGHLTEASNQYENMVKTNQEQFDDKLLEEIAKAVSNYNSTLERLDFWAKINVFWIEIYIPLFIGLVGCLASGYHLYWAW